MTDRELDILLFGAATGTACGTWLGWHLRKAIAGLTSRRAHEKRAAFREGPAVVGRSWPREQDVRKIARKQHQAQVIPLHRKLPQEFAAITEALPDAEQNEEHTDVVAALVGAGYKRSVAKAAVDACSPDERTTVEQWTVAALKKASTK